LSGRQDARKIDAKGKAARATGTSRKKSSLETRRLQSVGNGAVVVLG